MAVVRRLVGGYDVVAVVDGPAAGPSEPEPDAVPDEVPDEVPVVVLVHGIGVSSQYLARLGRELRDEAVVVAPDLVGFGRSPRAGEPLTVGEHADVLGGLLDALGDTLDALGARSSGPPLLVGHSMGAQVVTELAIRRPDLCRALVLLGPVVDPAARSPARQGLRLARDTPREPWSGVVVQVRAWLRTGVRWYLRTARRMCEHDLVARLPLVTAPVALVRGTRDPVTPSAFLDLLAHTSGARTVEVPGAAHLVMWSRPDAVASVCRAYLAVRT